MFLNAQIFNSAAAPLSMLRAPFSATNSLGDYEHKPAICNEVFEAIKPVYEELSNDDLLTRCIGGFTQNNNESLTRPYGRWLQKQYLVAN